MSMSIVGIEKAKFAIPLFAEAHYEEWKHLSKKYTKANFEEWIRKICFHQEVGTGIERMFVAVEGNVVLGDICLLASDLPHKKSAPLTKLSPWFASLYVFEEYRKLGVGTKLSEFLIAFCRANRRMPIYLVTEKVWLEKWYTRFGFERMELCGYNGHKVTFMKLEK